MSFAPAASGVGGTCGDRAALMAADNAPARESTLTGEEEEEGGVWADVA